VGTRRIKAPLEELDQQVYGGKRVSRDQLAGFVRRESASSEEDDKAALSQTDSDREEMEEQGEDEIEGSEEEDSARQFMRD
jgi:hypothetical protein